MSQGTVSLAHPKVLNHVVKMGIFGAIGGRAAMVALEHQSEIWVWLLWIGVVWPTLAGCLRNLHALLVFPRLQLSPKSLWLRYWRPTRFFTWGMFRPWNSVVDVTIPWSDFRGSGTRSFSGGDPWDGWNLLWIRSRTAEHEIGWDVFARGTSRLSADITCYLEREFRSAEKEAADAVGFNRQRFHHTLRLVRKPFRTSGSEIGCAILSFPFMAAIWCVAILMAGLGLFIVIGLVSQVFDIPAGLVNVPMNLITDTKLESIGIDSEVPLAVPIVVCLGCLLALGVMLIPDKTVRCLELREAGLALGKSPDRLRLVPWENIVGTRVVESTTFTTRNGATSTSAGTELHIHVAGRAPIVLDQRFDEAYTFEQLEELINPPAYLVEAARRHMATGLNVEAAAIKAGLARRTDLVETKSKS